MFQIIRSAVFLTAILAASAARADSDKLPTTSATFVSDFRTAALRNGLHEGLTQVECHPATDELHGVCNYKLGEFAMLLSNTPKGSPEITEVTAICMAKTDLNAMKCMLLNGVLMDWLAPSVDRDARGKIMAVLIKGIDVGTDVRVANEETRFIMQKTLGAGLWFHVEAVDAAN